MSDEPQTVLGAWCMFLGMLGGIYCGYCVIVSAASGVA